MGKLGFLVSFEMAETHQTFENIPKVRDGLFLCKGHELYLWFTKPQAHAVLMVEKEDSYLNLFSYTLYYKVDY